MSFAAGVALAVALAPAPASAQAPATKLTASGTAQRAPEPLDPRKEASIRRAVAVAEAAALPAAVADARAHAAELAAAAGVTLGALISISDAPANSFPFYYSQAGTFPNGRLRQGAADADGRPQRRPAPRVRRHA